MAKVDGAHLLTKALRQHGVERIFGLCGDHVNPIFNACIDEGIQIIDTRQESAAVHMADAWARVTGKPGVSVVTGGPGHTNSITGLATAWLASSPLIAISGQYDTSLKDRGALQEMDQVAVVEPVTKWSRLVTDPARLPEYIALAWKEATTGRPGPVHLSVPVNVAAAEQEEGQVCFPPPASRLAAGGEPKLIEQAIDRLARAERPCVIAGSGIWWAGAAGTLRRFVELTHLPLFTIGMGRGSVSDDNPLCLGYADQFLNPAAKEIKGADVVLLIGKRVDFRLGYGALFGSETTLIQVDVHAPELSNNRPADLPILADARVALEQLTAEAETRKGWRETPWLHTLQKGVRDARDERRREEESNAVPIAPLRVAKEIRELADENAVFVIDGGDFAQWCRLALPARKPGHWIRLGPMGTIGASIPFAIAAKLAKPDSTVVNLVGDGAFAFHGWEFHTAVRHGLPFVCVVGNDQGWGMERELQAAFYGRDRTIGVELGMTRYDRVVEAIGGHGEFVESPEDLRPALERAMKSGLPACVNVLVQGQASPVTLANITRHKR